MFRKLFLILTLVFAMVVTPNNLAYAHEEAQKGGMQYDDVINGPNGKVLYVNEYATISPVEDVGLILAVSGCFSFELGRIYYNYFGVPVAAYSQRIYWCYNGSTITSVSHWHIPEVYHFLYRYNGLIADSHSGGAGYTYFNAYSQANFCEYAPGLGCIWYFYPWISQTVYGNGSYGGSTGG